MSYIIRDDELIAYTAKTYKSGLSVKYAYDKTKNTLDANRDYDLVNARAAKISNAKKWTKEEERTLETNELATELNENEFYI